MKPTSHSAGGAPERTFERLTLNQRVQHVILMVSFTTLVVTGLPVRYHETPWAGWMFTLMGGPDGRAVLHRVAAIALMGLGIYHMLYMLFSEAGHKAVRDLIPRFQDARDNLDHLRYYVGLRKEPPRFGRFSYVEKFEYLAVVWGTIVMAGTGLLLWFEVPAMTLVPKWVLDICRVVHGYEAVLAFAAIVIWHLYCVHFNPDVFPMSRVWLDGRITESEMKHHHPLEYEEMMQREREAPRLHVGPGATPPAAGRPGPAGKSAPDTGMSAPVAGQSAPANGGSTPAAGQITPTAVKAPTAEAEIAVPGNGAATGGKPAPAGGANGHEPAGAAGAPVTPRRPTGKGGQR